MSLASFSRSNRTTLEPLSKGRIVCGLDCRFDNLFFAVAPDQSEQPRNGEQLRRLALISKSSLV
jgi:hypothetical protein